MKPETVKKLQENVPELRELVAFLAMEAAKLNVLDDLDSLPVSERGDVVSGRMWAYKTISRMLAPLVGAVEVPGRPDPSEYAVDVDTISPPRP